MPEKRQSRVSPKRSETHSGGKTQEAQTSEASQARGARGNRLRDELDDLLEEIDQVLETNAEEFVNSYVQKGGQ